jgi:tryptophan synthase beta chain
MQTTIEPTTSFEVSDKGFYGHFGGAFIPEMLHPNVEELRQNYRQIVADPAFQSELKQLLED